MSQAKRVLLMLSVAVLLLPGESSVTSFLQELKNSMFVTDTIMMTSEKPDTCSDEDQIGGTCSPPTSLSNQTDTWNTTVQLLEDGRTSVETGNASGTENLEDTSPPNSSNQVTTNETTQMNYYNTNYTQYYDEQDWNGTYNNGTFMQESSESIGNETGITEKGNSYTNDTKNDKNMEILQNSKNLRIKRDIKNENLTLLTGTPLTVNTTVFSTKPDNSAFNLSANKTNKFHQSEKATQQNSKIDTNNTKLSFQNRSTISYNSLKINSSITPTENNDNHNVTIINDRNEIDFPNSTQLKDYNSTSSEVYVNLMNMTDPILEEETSNLTRQFIINDLKLNSTNTTETETTINRSMENITTSHNFTTLNETSVASELKDNLTKNLSLEETQKIKENVSNISTNSDIVEETEINATNTTNNQTMDNEVPSSFNSTEAKLKKTILENMVINSTQIVEQFFNDIANDEPPMGPELLSMLPEDSSHRIKRSTEINNNTSTDITTHKSGTETVTEMYNSQNNSIEGVSILNLKNETITSSQNYNESEYGNENTIVKGLEHENYTISSVNTTAEDDVLVNSGADMNITDSVLHSHQYSNISMPLGDNITDYKDTNSSLAQSNVTSETDTPNSRVKRSITLTIGWNDENNEVTIGAETIKNGTDAFMNETFDTTAQTTEAACNSQNEKCNDSTECCKPLICVKPDEANSTSFCDFRPSHPILPTPVAFTRNFEQIKL